jgi:hypothetical protein
VVPVVGIQRVMNQANTSLGLHMRGCLVGLGWDIYVAKDVLICNLDIVEPSNHPHKILMPLVAE